MKALIVLLGIVGLAGACATAPQPVAQVAPNGKQVTIQLSRDARSLMAREPGEEALGARKELLARKDLTESMLASVAELSLLGGRTDEAANQARALLKKDFKNTEAMKTLIKVSLFTKRHQEAILMADNALQVAPTDPDILCLKGLAFYYLEDVFAARDTWKKALEASPTHVTALMNLSTLYFHNRNVSLAGAGFEKVLALQPANLDAQVGRAMVLDLQGNSEESRRVLEALVSKNAKSPLVLYNLAALERFRFDNYEKALGYMEAYIQESGRDRASMEKAVAQREELRNLVAKKKTQKMSDDELRQLASRSSQAVRGAESDKPEAVREVAQEQAPAPKPQATPQPAAQAAPAAAPAAQPVTSPRNDDPAALEEAIK